MSKDIFEDWINEETKPDEYYKDMKVKFKGTLGQVNYPKGGMDDYGYAIVRLNVLEVLEGEFHPSAYNYRNMISVKGEMARLEANEVNEFTVEIDEISEQWGASYKLLYKRTDFDFSDVAQQKIFFEAFLTENQIVNMFEAFESPIEVLENGDIEKLCEVKGVGYALAEKILQRYEMNKDYAEAFVELAQYDLTIKAIMKLCDNYGSPDALINIIKNNPYVLTEVDGYGFAKADEIAMKSGVNPNSTERVMAFINYTLLNMGEQGMSWIDSQHLLYLIEDSLEGISMDTVIDAVSELKELKLVWNETKGVIGAMRFYELELRIVGELYRLMNAPTPEIPEGWKERVKEAELLQGRTFVEGQSKAIDGLLDKNVGILRGLAGTGKTSTALGLVKATDIRNFKLVCLAGKASARLQEATGYPASTIHRCLVYNPMGFFEHNKDNQLRTELVILDEYSLVGGRLFYSLIQAIPTGARLWMLGDFGQLSAIGSLNIALDTVNSKVIPDYELTEIHRQAQKSAIITESIKARHGIQLFEKEWTGTDIRGELQDLKLNIVDKAWKIEDLVLEQFREYIEIEKDILEVQILTPMNLRGDSSVYAFNHLIQNEYNPPSDDKKEVLMSINKKQYYNLRVGDKVINTKNLYQADTVDGFKADVFNGYTGILVEIRGESLIIDFPLASEEYIIIPKSHWNGQKAISLGYAISTHKSQGSGFNRVISVLDNSHYKMLCRQQIYTMLTRAQLHCTLIGVWSAIWRAIETDEVANKQTFMEDLLKEYEIIEES